MKAGNDGRSPWSTLKRLLGQSKSYIPWYVTLGVASVLRSGLTILDTESFRRMINGATGHDMILLQSGLKMAIAVLLATAVVELASSYFGEVLDLYSTLKLQSALVSKFGRTKMSSLDKLHSGDLIERVGDSAYIAQSGVNRNTRQVVESILSLVFILSYMTVINFQMMLSSLVFAAVLPLMVNPLSKKLRRLYDERQKIKARSDAFAQDVVQGAEVVRSFCLTGRLTAMFRDIYGEFLVKTRSIIKCEGFIGNANFLVIVGGDFFILATGGYMAYKGILEIGDVLGFLLLFERLSNPVSVLSRIWPQFQQAISMAGRVFDVLDLPDEENYAGECESGCKGESKGIHKVHKGIHKGKSGGYRRSSGISFKEVTFGYTDSNMILKGLNFTAESGKVTALVGPSGSGKSTVVKLLLKLYSASSGCIACDGCDLEQIPTGQWRSKIAYVCQGTALFSGTIYENIVYGRPEAKEAEVIEAARAAGIHDFIMSTPEGYRTRVGERGMRVSGGEAQRISITRAILASPDILVLDEPTSSLDSESEQLVQRALDVLMKGRTTLVVAHRLSTIRNADKIVYIQDGRVEEEGSHSSLMALKGKYYTSYSRNQEKDTGCWNMDAATGKEGAGV